MGSSEKRIEPSPGTCTPGGRLRMMVGFSVEWLMTAKPFTKRSTCKLDCRPGSHSVRMAGLRADIRGRCAVVAAERTIEIGQVAKAHVVSDHADLLAGAARIGERAESAREALRQ